jgi:hypothetical protein
LEKKLKNYNYQSRTKLGRISRIEIQTRSRYQWKRVSKYWVKRSFEGMAEVENAEEEPLVWCWNIWMNEFWVVSFTSAEDQYMERRKLVMKVALSVVRQNDHAECDDEGQWSNTILDSTYSQSKFLFVQSSLSLSLNVTLSIYILFYFICVHHFFFKTFHPPHSDLLTISSNGFFF